MPLRTQSSGAGASAAEPNGTAAFPINVSASASAPTQIATGQISVATTATQIVAARAGRASVIIVNHGTVDVFLGPSGVTTADGLLLRGAIGTAAAIDSGAAVFGIVAAATQPVSFMETF